MAYLVEHPEFREKLRAEIMAQGTKAVASLSGGGE